MRHIPAPQDAESSPPDDPQDIALRLYEAVLDGAGLLPALRGLAARLGASAHAVHRIRYRDGLPVGSISAGEGGVSGAVMEAYARYWVRHDPWAQAAARLPPGVHDIAAHVPTEALRRSRIWAEWGRPNDAAFHALAVPLLREGDSMAGVFFHRREREAAFGDAERRLLGALFPHLRRVLTVEARLADGGDANGGDAGGGAARAGLDTLPDGIAVLDTARRLVFANAALLAMAGQADGLALGAEGIEVPDPGLRLALGRAVTAALAAVAGQVGLLPLAGSLALPRPSGRAPWLVRAMPVRRGVSGAIGEGFQGAMLLVSDPERRRNPPAILLTRLFGLTAAEAALAAALAAGRPMAEHARRRGISVETARSHMAAIRRKTGCRRQADLAALLARLPG